MFTHSRAALLHVALWLFGLLLAVGAEARPSLQYRPIPNASPIALPDRPIDPQELETFFDGLIGGQFAAHKLAGTAVVVVRDGKPVFEKGYGFADVEKAIPVDPARTRFTVGSVSKLFVWTAVMQLVEQRRLDLDVDINRYLSKFKIHDRYATPVTLRALLTHSAGFEETGTPFSPQIAGRYRSLGDFLAHHLPPRAMPPVKDYAHASRPYSNWGPLLAAHVVENVSKERFDRYVDHHILQPLGMTSSGFQAGLGAGGANRALGYRFNNGAMVGELEDMTSSGAAGALIATPDDIGHFMIAHLENGAFGDSRILAPRTAATMHRRSAQSNPYLNGMALGFIESYQNGRRTLRHDGATQLSHSELMLFPEEKLGLFITYNSYEGGYARPESIKAFVDHYFPATIPRIIPQADFARRALEYTGDYRGLRRSYSSYEKLLGSFPINVSALGNGRLLAAGSQWTEVAPDIFRNDAGELLGFNRNALGKVDSLNLKYSIVPAERIAWYENVSIHALIFVLCLGCAITAIAWGVRRRGWKKGSTWYLRSAGWFLAGTGALNLLSFVLIAVVLAQGVQVIMASGVPAALYVGLSLALMSVPMTLACVVVAAAMFKAGFRSRAARISYAGLAAASAIYLGLLHYWNLLGLHLG